jgi:tripartite-type tricarboxylate transporter receptor subunit TctC
MKSFPSRPAIAVLLAAGGALFGASAVSAQSVAEFYKGKTIRMVVASDPGGGYDVYARTFAPHFARHLPGQPSIIVQNMQGAGGVLATNWIYGVAPKDGTTIAMTQRGVPFLALFGKQGPTFDPTKFNWIGSLNNETGVITLWHTSKVKTLEDAMKTESLIGGSGPNDTETYPALMNNTIGTKFRIISGYPSTTGISLAMERGEIEGMSQSWGSLITEKPDWVRDKKVSVLVQITAVKHKDMPDVPTIMDYVKDPEHRTIWQLMLAQKAMGRPFVAPPDIPADRAKALQDAFDAAVKDPLFIAEMERTKKELTPVSGAEIAKMIAEVAAAPKAILAKVESYTNYRGQRQVVKIADEKHSGKVTKVEEGGRAIAISAAGKEITTKISGSRTKLQLDGKEAKREQLRAGLTCTITAKPGADEADLIECKSGG